MMQELDCPQKGWIVCQAIGTELCKVGLFVGLSRNRCKNNNCICTSAFVGKVCVLNVGRLLYLSVVLVFAGVCHICAASFYVRLIFAS